MTLEIEAGDDIARLGQGQGKRRHKLARPCKAMRDHNDGRSPAPVAQIKRGRRCPCARERRNRQSRAILFQLPNAQSHQDGGKKTKGDAHVVPFT